MTQNINISEMLISVGGDLLKSASSLEEMQARVDIVRTAWNMSLISRTDRKVELRQFIKGQKAYAPNREALKGLESEMKRIIRQKNITYPEIDSEVVKAQATQKGQDNYQIKAHFQGSEEAIGS